MKKNLKLLFVILGILSLCGCGKGGSSANLITQVNGVWKIKTPYCELRVPEEYAETVKAEVKAKDPYALTFTTIETEQELFTLHFGGETDNLIGTLPLENENVILYVDFAELDSEDAGYQRYCGYQEEINTIINYLVSDYDFITNNVIEYENDETFDIQTNLLTLKYPKKWEKQINVKEEGNRVLFSVDGIELFAVVFEECEGDFLGIYNDVPVYIVTYLIDENKYSEDQYYTFCAMQEDINVIIQHLMK